MFFLPHASASPSTKIRHISLPRLAALNLSCVPQFFRIAYKCFRIRSALAGDTDPSTQMPLHRATSDRWLFISARVVNWNGLRAIVPSARGHFTTSGARSLSPSLPAIGVSSRSRAIGRLQQQAANTAGECGIVGVNVVAVRRIAASCTRPVAA